MPKKSNNGKGVAFAKRAKIDSAQKNMLVAVCATSVLLGVTAVGTIYMFKKISFNNVKKTENSTVIKNFTETQKSLSSLTVSVGDLANNQNLEVVGQKRSASCNNKIATDESGEYSIEDISLARTCSALRVISDTLPATSNQDASNSSLNYLLLYRNPEINIEGISTAEASFGGSSKMVDESGQPLQLKSLATSINLKDSATTVRNAMDSIESSIRNFDITSVTLGMSTDADNKQVIELSATYDSYYSDPVQIVKERKVICADDTTTACSKKKGSGVTTQ